MRGLPGRSTEPEATDSAVLAERLESLATWVQDLDAQLRATTVAQDPKAAKELAKAIESWTKHGPKLEERMTGRFELLAERIATVADTANTTAGALAGKQGEIAALRRELEQANARLDEALRHVGRSGSSTDIAELRAAVAALSSERQTRSRESGSGLMPAKADVLAERIDMLAKTVATTAAGLAGREGELAMLRRGLDEAGARTETLVAGLRASIDILSAHVTGLDERTLDLGSVRGLHEHVDELAAGVESLTRRVETIAAGVDAAAATLGNREREFAAMHRHFEEASMRIEAALAELETGLAVLPKPGTVDPAVETRFGSLDRQLQAVTAHLAELEAATRAMPSVEPALEAVEVRLAHLGDRIEAMEHDRPAAPASEVAGPESGHTAFERRLTSLESRLETLAGDPASARDTDGLLVALTARLDAIEAREEPAGSPDMGALVDGLRVRLASAENELAALAGGHEAGPRVDKLAARLDAVERAGATLPAALSAASEGRARVELQALELRVEHGEEAARQNREAVLTELERLATRIEWRLQQLEAAVAAQPAVDDSASDDAPLGHLVPIRSEA